MNDYNPSPAPTLSKIKLLNITSKGTNLTSSFLWRHPLKPGDSLTYPQSVKTEQQNQSKNRRRHLRCLTNTGQVANIRSRVSETTVNKPIGFRRGRHVRALGIADRIEQGYFVLTQCGLRRRPGRLKLGGSLRVP